MDHAEGQDGSGALLHNLLLFGRVLHGLGLEVNPGRMIEVQEALQHICIGHRSDFYYTLRACLVRRREELPLFDQAFALFWRKPPVGSPELDLRDLRNQYQAEDRSGVKPVNLLPQPNAVHPDTSLDETDPAAWEAAELTRTYSARERLRQKDFAQLTAGESAAIRQMIAALTWQVDRRRTRRNMPGHDGVLDMRRSLRRNLHHGGELLLWSYRTPKMKPRPLIIIADVSGSMERYTRLLLHFMHAMAQGQARHVEVFLFGTRLTCISRQLRTKDVDRALDNVTRVVRDWSGGTRMGEALKEFNFVWGRRVLQGGPVVLLISDGWDRGDPGLLNREMGRLRRFCRRIVWLNPLLGSVQYEPLTRGMVAALPFIDDFLPVHNLASLEDLTGHLNRLDGRRVGREGAMSLRGAAFVGARKR